MKFKPFNNKLLVKPDEAVEKIESGIILAVDSQEKPTTGIILVGTKSLPKGGKVVFSKFGYDEVVVDNETLYVISEANILGEYEN